MTSNAFSPLIIPSSNSRCSCAATTICRHLIRSVLVYQHAATQDSELTQDTTKSSESHESTENLKPESRQRVRAASPQERRQHKGANPKSIPWNPGEIADEELAKHYKKAALSRARQLFESGHVIELIRTPQPIAHFNTLSCTLRFLVPGDIRYTHCDCAESAPCSHVPLAVWAFRLLKDESSSGIISTQASLPIPVPLLDDIEQALQELVEFGIVGATGALIGRFRRLEARCREENLVWPAEIIAELLQEHERYVSHDARFSPTRVVELVGELCIRSDAIRNDTGAVPQLFIRGSSSDKLTEIGSARLVGLGCGIQINRHVTLTAYLQDTDSGTIVATCRDFTAPQDDIALPKPFWQLAQTPAMKGISFASLGAGQLLIKGGKRSPSCQLIPGRAKATVNPQTFNWESIRAPVLAADFSEIYSHLSTLPPAALRPRRMSENFHVCAIASVEAVEFSPAEQAVRAILHDQKGDRATLTHPYTHRSREGTEALLSNLQGPISDLRFVAGQVCLNSRELVIAPISLVFQQGETRTILQPWIERWEVASSYVPSANAETLSRSHDPLASYLVQMTEALAELFVTGLQQTQEPTTRYWQELHQSGRSLGFVRLLDSMMRLVEMLEQKSNSIRWDGKKTAEAALEMALLARLIQLNPQEPHVSPVRGA